MTKAKDDLIAYKVVGKQHRYGTNATLYITGGNQPSDGHGLASLKRNIDYLQIQEYFPRYRKGTKVEAVPGSVGILCFGSRKDAQRFIEYYWDQYLIKSPVKIVKVKGFSKITTPFRLASGCSDLGRIRNLSRKEAVLSVNPPNGTIAFKAVEVLE
jgi:hypothetical protein